MSFFENICKKIRQLVPNLYNNEKISNKVWSKLKEVYTYLYRDYFSDDGKFLYKSTSDDTDVFTLFKYFIKESEENINIMEDIILSTHDTYLINIFKRKIEKDDILYLTSASISYIPGNNNFETNGCTTVLVNDTHVRYRTFQYISYPQIISSDDYLKNILEIDMSFICSNGIQFENETLGYKKDVLILRIKTGDSKKWKKFYFLYNHNDNKYILIKELINIQTEPCDYQTYCTCGLGCKKCFNKVIKLVNFNRNIKKDDDDSSHIISYISYDLKDYFKKIVNISLNQIKSDIIITIFVWYVLHYIYYTSMIYSKSSFIVIILNIFQAFYSIYRRFTH
jgi:hypothetical protein